MTLIEVRNLDKKYGDHIAVNNLNFTVNDGQIYGFLGPNGAGKSTTMNIMTGYIGATSGDVIIEGHNIAEEPELAKKCIGYLPEIPPLYVDMTVYEYLVFAARLKKIPKAEIRENVEKVMELTKITDKSKRLIKNLSKGYKQRVGLSQALLGFPKIIILDEPTVGLDPMQIIEIRDLIKSLAVDHTVILSSHIMQEISAVCDHIMIISHGCLVASDTPENLEKLLSGYNTIEISADCTQEKAKEILSQIEGINKAEYSSDGSVTNIVVTTDTKVDLRSNISMAFVNSGVPLLAIQLKTANLEDVFLELTQNNSAENSTSGVEAEMETKDESSEEAAEAEPKADTDKEVQ